MNPLKNNNCVISLSLLFMFMLSSCTKEEPDVDVYEIYQLSGFEVKVEKRALEINAPLTQKAIDRLEEDLQEIANLGLKHSILESLQSVTIFLDWNTSSRLAVYHPSLDWLVENGYAEEKFESVEIPSVGKFLGRTALNQPYIILHELAHAYHHQVLGPFNESVTEAYNNAISLGLYRDVSFETGTGIIIAPLAYAYTDEREYFAELTEAYFGWNAYFPFIKADLEIYDPTGFDLIEAAWEL